MRVLLTGFIGGLLIASQAFAAEPKPLGDGELDRIVAGQNLSLHFNCARGPAGCGNNGWGNGQDAFTPGSFKGKAGLSKSANEGTLGDGRMNVNPTFSSGR
jgi:hypothetical protein